MATLKDDDSGWKASGLKKKRKDWEHDPKPPAIKSKKKDTKKWCKGKVGREHDVQTVLCVTLNKNCFTRERCGHWRHHETKCVGCGKSYWRIPDAKKDKEQVALEEKWCDKGHLYDWMPSKHRFGSAREIKTCLMCGKTKGKSRLMADE